MTFGSLCCPLDQVTRVSRNASTSEPGTSPPATDVEMEDREPEPEPEPEPKPKPKPGRKPQQRKPKKEVPVGRNGLKKRRVVKSRMTTDAKGYFGASLRCSHYFPTHPCARFSRIVDGATTLCGVLTYAVTEDYSSYESVDEEDVAAAPPVKPAKGKGKKAAAPIVVKDEGGADEEKVAKAPLKAAASTLKRKPSKPSVQKGGIASYFTKK